MLTHGRTGVNASMPSPVPPLSYGTTLAFPGTEPPRAPAISYRRRAAGEPAAGRPASTVYRTRAGHPATPGPALHAARAATGNDSDVGYGTGELLRRAGRTRGWTRLRGRWPRPRQVSGELVPADASADDPDVLRLGSLLALRDAELHLLPFLKAAVAGTRDRADVHEQVRTALDRDKAVALIAVEPLHCAPAPS